MKKQILFGLGMFAFSTIGSAQDVSSTSTLTSGGNNAGTLGTSGVYYGKDAGDLVTSVGLNNTLIGHEAGKVLAGGDDNVFLGFQAGIASTANFNTFLGSKSGLANTTGRNNTFIGRNSGAYGQTGFDNVYIGDGAGNSNSVVGYNNGNSNVFVGNLAGSASKGSENTFLGYRSGYSSGSTGTNNSYIGCSSGYNATGSSNIYMGARTGYGNSGSSNIFIGNDVGSWTTASNMLYISNVNDTTPLISGNFGTDNLVFNGKVGITEEILADQVNLFPTLAGSVDVSAYQLFVKGGILTEAVRVQLKTDWADYVFADNYKLLPLEDVACFIAENGHLPNVPSAEDVKNDGIELAEMAVIQQEKIEELTLYAIAQDKYSTSLEAKLAEQERDIKSLQKQMAEMKLLLDQMTENKKL
jgi:trimeric autotransporter adhesin